MVRFTTIILKYGKKGEKTGWTYIDIPAGLAGKLKPGNKKSFRVKGRLDKHPISMVALLPSGDGSFIMPLNAALRKAIGKREGAVVTVQLEEDKNPFVLHPGLMECLKDEPGALHFFYELPGSHQRYFSKWIESAKTEETIAKRIAQTVTAMLRQQNFPEMMRANKRLPGY